jgi:hypothetical protein
MIGAFIVGRLDRVVGRKSPVAVCVVRSAFLDSVGNISIIVSIHNLQFLF